MYACNIYAKYIMQIMFFSFKMLCFFGVSGLELFLFFLTLEGIYNSLSVNQDGGSTFQPNGRHKTRGLFIELHRKKKVMFTFQIQLLLVTRFLFASLWPCVYLYTYMGQGSLVKVQMGLVCNNQLGWS